MKEIKTLSLFSGIGAFEKALFNIGVKTDLINYCEIDKYASCAYSAIHEVPEDKNLWDVTKIDPKSLADFDLVTHGSPCQDFSVAGKGKGGNENSGTRSSLMWYTVNIIRNKNPKYVLWENVKGVLSQKHKHNFDKYIKELDELGYNSYHKVLNSKGFGIPQNRERIFVVSIRKDIDKGYIFPQETPLKNKVRDFLEEEVSEKYYWSNEKIKFLIRRKEQGYSSFIQDSYAKCFKASLSYLESNMIPVFTIKNGTGHKDFIPTLETTLNMSYPSSNSKRGRVKEGYTPTLLTQCTTGVFDLEDYKIRKLMPLETWRLQGFSNEDYWKARKQLEHTFYKGKDRSNSQMYKMSGNSITVTVLEHIFKNLFTE